MATGDRLAPDYTPPPSQTPTNKVDPDAELAADLTAARDALVRLGTGIITRLGATGRGDEIISSHSLKLLNEAVMEMLPRIGRLVEDLR